MKKISCDVSFDGCVKTRDADAESWPVLKVVRLENQIDATRFSTLVFTSTHAVEIFFERTNAGKSRCVAVGPETHAALLRYVPANQTNAPVEPWGLRSQLQHLQQHQNVCVITARDGRSRTTVSNLKSSALIFEIYELQPCDSHVPAFGDNPLFICRSGFVVREVLSRLCKFYNRQSSEHLPEFLRFEAVGESAREALEAARVSVFQRVH